jgi:hypothetical protein
MPASAAAAPSTWGRLSSTVALVTAVLAVMLIAFALPQLHLHPHKIPIAVAGLAPATRSLAHSWKPASPTPSTSPPYRTLARRASASSTTRITARSWQGHRDCPCSRRARQARQSPSS